MKKEDIHNLREEFHDLQKSWVSEEKRVSEWINSKSIEPANMKDLQDKLKEDKNAMKA